MEVKITTLPKMRVAYMRHTGPYEECGKAWEKLMAWAGPAGVLGLDTQMAGMGYDDPRTTPPEKLRYDACITIGPDVKVSGEVQIQEIGGGEYATVKQVGPYEKLPETYMYLYDEWSKTSGRTISDRPAIEFYRNDPETTPTEELITEIYVPLE
jgi:AraC family transcriptional regulator